MKKTTILTQVSGSSRKWFVVDASSAPLGKLTVQIARALMGKNRVDFTPHVDGGGYVVVLNSEKVRVTGNKETQKMYYRHSGYKGHLKTASLKEVREKKPEQILKQAVSGMLPKNRHRKLRLDRLKLIFGSSNPHEAQNPEILTV